MRACLILLLAVFSTPLLAHDAHGRANAPLEARRLRSPLKAGEADLAAGKAAYGANCASCHGEDGKARTATAGKLPTRPTDLSNYLMESMRDGEIYWVVTQGISQSMPPFEAKLDEKQRWQVVLYVRELRSRQQRVEVSELGPYRWSLPPGFPYPKVPADNLMTEAKVELGRHLFYDHRLSMNQTQSCASCHKQERAFADERGRGKGSTGQLHPRGPMSLANVAYSPILTWANPNMRDLEKQALVPMFGDDPVELGMVGKEDLLLQRLRKEPRYGKLFADAYPDTKQPFTLANITKAIASFERTILSGDSPYDVYRRGDDASAISESAKRGEALFFSERLECFHCHGGFNFTGSVDYYGKGFGEVEFHNTGLYNLKGKFSYPEPNLGLYTFTESPDDVGKFKAPTLRNIAVTAPYMHDGSVRTLEEAIDHYASGGRTVKSGPLAGVGSKNPNKSEFVKGFQLAVEEKADLIAFLRSLTDTSLLTNPALSDPWTKTAPANPAPTSIGKPLTGQVVDVFPDEGTVTLYHDEVPGLMGAMKPPYAMEFVLAEKSASASLKAGMKIRANVRRQGRDFILSRVEALK